MVDVISSMKVMRRGLKNSKSLVLYPWCMAVIVSVYHMEVGIIRVCLLKLIKACAALIAGPLMFAFYHLEENLTFI